MPPSPFGLVGRDAVRAAIAAAIERDEPVALLGEAGVGKTTLMRAAAARANREAHEGGALGLLDWMPYLALERALGRGLSGPDELVAREVIDGVGAGLLILDDLQWAHPATLAILERLAPRIAVLAAVRAVDPGSPRAIDALTLAGFAIQTLEPLDPESAETMVAGLRPDLPRSRQRSLAAASGGNPLFIEELSRTDDDAPILDGVVRLRLDGLSEAGLLAMARLARAAESVPDAALGSATVELVGRGLAIEDGGRVWVRHELLGAAAVRRLDAEQIRRIDRELAAAATSPGIAARHLLRAGDTVAAHRAALEAASAATSDIERAAHLRLASQTASSADADAIRLDAAFAFLDAELVADARAEVDLVATDDPRLAGRRALADALTTQADGMPDRAYGIAMDGLGLGDLPPEVEVGLRVSVAFAAAYDPEHVDEALALSTEAVRRAIEVGSQIPAARSAHAQALFRSGDPAWDDENLTAAAEARARGDETAEIAAMRSRIFILLRAGRTNDALLAADALMTRGRELDNAVCQEVAESWRVGLLWHAGRFREAADLADARMADLGHDDEFYRSQAALDLGWFEEGRVRSERMLAIAKDGEFDRGEALWLVADAAVMGGRWATAARTATEHGDRFPEAQHRPFVVVSGAWASLALGRGIPALPEPAGLALLDGAPIETRGVSELSTGDHRSAARSFLAAAEAWHGRHERGALRSRWAGAEALRQAGATAEARVQLLALEEELVALGAGGWLPRVRRSLRQSGVRRTAPRERVDGSPLTVRELEILRLVAHGARDQEIAGRLGVSRWAVVRAVESASAKLGASNRAQAIQRLPA